MAAKVRSATKSREAEGFSSLEVKAQWLAGANGCSDAGISGFVKAGSQRSMSPAVKATTASHVHLQGLGDLPGIPAQSLQVGMLLSWNYRYQGYEVVAIREKSAHFIEIVERNRQNGTESTRALKKTRLVVAHPAA